MVEIPVQHCGQQHLGQFLDLAPQRTALQTHFVCNRHQLGQRHASQRHRESLPKSRQAGALPVEPRHHRQTGKAAFGRFGLPHQRERPVTGEIEQVQPLPKRQMPR